MAFWIQGNLYKTTLTREILHQSMWNWALNFLSQLMTGSISWLQRSWLCGLSTSRRHDEKGTSAPTITYTLERGRDDEIQSMKDKRRGEEKSLLFSSLSSTECSPRCFHLPKRQHKSLMCNLWHFMWAIPFWTRPTDSVHQCWRPSELIKFTVKLFGPQAPVKQNVSMMWVGWKYKLLVWLRDEKKLHVDKIRKDCYSLMCTTCYTVYVNHDNVFTMQVMHGINKLLQILFKHQLRSPLASSICKF